VIKTNGGADVLEYITDFKFPVPKDGKLLVHTVSLSVNPVDIYIRKGLFGALAESPTVRFMNAISRLVVLLLKSEPEHLSDFYRRDHLLRTRFLEEMWLEWWWMHQDAARSADNNHVCGKLT
jgi:hypothetical protein